MKNKRNAKLIILTICFLLLTSLGLPGCGDGESASSTSADGDASTSDVTVASLVLGAHANFPGVSISTSSIYDTVYAAAYSYGSVSIIIADGSPYLAANYHVNAPSVRIDKQKKNQLATQNTISILEDAASYRAMTAEVDTLAAIILGAQALQSTEADSHKVMIICDSGMCTTGLCSLLNQDLLSVSETYIAEQLRELRSLPDLSGVSVIWIGLGSVCGEQASLSANDKYQLQMLWEAILVAGGASSVTFDSTPLASSETNDDLPSVSIIPVVLESLDLSGAVTEEELQTGIRWDGESSLSFQGASADFVDAEAALAELEPIAAYLVENPQEVISIFGMTASLNGGDESELVALSLMRAQTCQEMLLALGANEDQILCYGLGSADNCLRVDDLDASGMQIEDLACKNRAVIITLSDSALAAQLQP